MWKTFGLTRTPRDSHPELMSDCCMGTHKVPQVQILPMAWLHGRIPFQAYRYTMSYGKDVGIMRDNGVVVGLGAWVFMLMEAILSNSVHESPPNHPPGYPKAVHFRLSRSSRKRTHCTQGPSMRTSEFSRWSTVPGEVYPLHKAVSGLAAGHHPGC